MTKDSSRNGEWAKAAHAFLDLFRTYERRLADRMLREYFPDADERVTAQY